MELDCLVATTYSASLDTVLTLPGAMLLEGAYAAARKPGTFTPADLAALKRVCARTMVFCQGAAILAAELVPPAIIEAEQIVHEVTAPNGGSFHPKVWVARFRRPDEATSILRVSVMSRNITGDASWDAGVVIESGVALPTEKRNDLGDLLRMLPGRCLRALGKAQKQLLSELIRQAETVKWRMPSDVGRPSFHLVGERPKGGWRQPECDRLAILSPFLTAPAIELLAGAARKLPFIVSRPDALEGCWSAVSERFDRKLILAAPENDDDGRRAPQLHAKMLIWERRKRAHVAIGSMNATTAAVTGRNVEFMVSFDCTKVAPNGIDALLERMNMGTVLEDFGPEAGQPPTATPFDDRPARACLLSSGLHLDCKQAGDGWEINLVPRAPQANVATLLPNLRYRPVTLAKSRSCACGESVAAGLPAPYPETLALAQITGFTHFEADGPDGPIAFVLNLEVRGVSDEDRRHAALKTLIPDSRSFSDFLRTLLGDFHSLDASSAMGEGSDSSEWRPGGHTGLLELLIRCATDEPERLASIRQTLNTFSAEELESVTTAEFRQLWTALLESAKRA